MYKQAYLIIAHKFDLTLKTLLSMLDKEENDIYLHMDVKNTQFNEKECKKYISSANIYFSHRTNVTWGGYSQINAELILLKKAISKMKYNYYHLISGEDLPIQKSGDIQNFFMNHEGYEFVGFDKQNFECLDRVRYFYPFQEKVGRNRKSLLGRISAILIFIQKVLGVKRNSKVSFQKGPNWFSITDELARYVVKKEKWIKSVFENTICCDEVFLQTIVINSKFKTKIFSMNVEDSVEKSIERMVDWERGNPYIFRISDFNELVVSDMMFARKFDSVQDSEIIRKLHKIYG